VTTYSEREQTGALVINSPILSKYDGFGLLIKQICLAAALLA